MCYCESGSGKRRILNLQNNINNCRNYYQSVTCINLIFPTQFHYFYCTCYCRCSPDFSLSRITNTLRLHTTKGSHFEFPLLATLPHHMLSLCYMATPPSDIEYMAAYFSVPLWIIALLIMIIVTVLQVMTSPIVLFLVTSILILVFYI